MNRHGGYATAAAWVALDAEDEKLVVRKFSKLAAANLLFLQAEIAELERKFDDVNARTIQSRDDAASAWEVMVQKSREGDGGQSTVLARERMDLILKIRATLKEYNEALVLQSQVSRLKPPDKHNLADLRDFFDHPYPIIGGAAKDFLQRADDLVAVKSPPDSDYLTSLLRRSRFFRSKDSEDGLRSSDEKHVTIAANVITVIVAAMFIIGPVTTFTAYFAISVGFITNAKRAEVFTATAAYAAVLVVFASSDNQLLKDSGN